MLKAIFFDRDGVINRPIIRDDLISSPRAFTEFEIYGDFAEMHALLRREDLLMFVVSNQPDIERKLLPENELLLMTEKMQQKFEFTEILHCPHSDQANCQCRKPKPGMITGLLKKHSIRSEEALILGDSEKDILAGKAAQIKTVLIRRSHNAELQCGADHELSDLREFLPLLSSFR
jgi:D-glycero-D-manno-heptose 1,7-bisphosphate phosphatase